MGSLFHAGRVVKIDSRELHQPPVNNDGSECAHTQNSSWVATALCNIDIHNIDTSKKNCATIGCRVERGPAAKHLSTGYRTGKTLNHSKSIYIIVNSSLLVSVGAPGFKLEKSSHFQSSTCLANRGPSEHLELPPSSFRDPVAIIAANRPPPFANRISDGIGM